MNKSTKCKAVLEQYNILYEQYKKIYLQKKIKSYQYYKKLSTIQVLTDLMDL